MKKLRLALLLFLGLLTLTSCKRTEREKSLIPEYAPQESIFIGFRNDIADLERDLSEYDSLDEWDSLNLNLALLTQDYVSVKLMVADSSLFSNPLETLIGYGLDTSKVKVMYQPASESFYQDVAPLFGLDKNGEMFGVDFQWTGYSNGIHNLDSLDQMTRQAGEAARHLTSALDIPVVELNLVLEGGAIEYNGKGTMILTEELMRARNPGKSLAEMEKELIQKLNIKQVIWLPKGAAEDPHIYSMITGNYYGLGTGGHTDEYVRFANDSTILLAWVSERESRFNPVDSLNYLNYQECFNILNRSRRPDGGRFTIVKIPSAPIQSEDMVVDTTKGWTPYYLNALNTQHGDSLIRVSATSYMNFVITNDLVIAPKYFSSGKDSLIYERDQTVARMLKQVFPDRRIEQLDPSLFNFYGGGFHCRFSELPMVE